MHKDIGTLQGGIIAPSYMLPVYPCTRHDVYLLIRPPATVLMHIRAAAIYVSKNDHC